MAQKEQVLKSIQDDSIVAVLRGTEEEVVKVARAAFLGGIKNIEVTLTVPNAFQVLQRIKEELGSSNVNVGMGTVLDSTSAVNAIHAGADFIVSPHLDEDIILACHKYKTLIMPGTMTLTEMVKALSAGCDIVKLFPASLTGSKYIKDVKGPIPQINIMPTGGVDENNIDEWIQAGAFAVGIGSNLKKAGGPEFDTNKITEYAKLLVEKVSEAKYLVSGS
ncbi:bifunctional 4-hydroxy-2-oxoglutarate aldolase/2-dehydro-3-deoxy-phosphogluconate aldolase [Paucisalibacillus sp. EB02]|uniref:bifunctional 4-hydroxy-2-oxoglutarate aldolase/2-dehydro-3-deoxy-phosphogluconate aldolase n=1 Tax=Paucisalibacillus sp. EB02 TaxID=1347087 RepID=UPI0004BC04BB|nr:bifunctional 2-keto-4-hydroxyglutarate aldolase/2-keto-3-deoxy-6-phosphogluconate aldolase [Paucisalibacillus sp. EB02]